MEQVLYRKYRSKTFDEVVGQNHIIKTLKNALKQGKISHAYLFTGPRGVGKTSVARLLAHEVNQLKYEPDSLHLDIIEIDAASNRRIDEVRNLRDKVHIAPASARYKVYIIDEVHMLTKEAFNALLKTLEEPPAHCIFILATTEAHKLPETIISRTQKFTFKPISDNDAHKHLANVAKKEKLNITPAALKLLAQHGGGSFRDSIGLLDQLSGLRSQIGENDVRELLGIPEEHIIDRLLNSLSQANTKEVLLCFELLWDQGADPLMVCKEISEKLRKNISDESDNTGTVALLKNLVEAPVSLDPKEYLEIILLEASENNLPIVQNKNAVSGPSKPKQLNSVPKAVKHLTMQKISTPQIDKSRPIVSQKTMNLNDWPEIVNSFKSKAPSLYTALRLAVAEIEDSELNLYFEFPLHQKKVNNSETLSTVEAKILETQGVDVKVICSVEKSKFTKKAEASIKNIEQKPILQDIDTISNIFGQAEVLES